MTQVSLRSPARQGGARAQSRRDFRHSARDSQSRAAGARRSAFTTNLPHCRAAGAQASPSTTGDRQSIDPGPTAATAYVALGANLGDREAAIRRAIERLADLGTVEAVSPLYETDPVGYLDQPAFLNAVARLRTDLRPDDLLAGLHRIEAEAGRVRAFRDAPRTLDLDLLFYDKLLRDDPALTLPHPRLHERAFVLVPLNDLTPDLVHPRLGQTVAELLAALGATGGVRRFETA